MVETSMSSPARCTLLGFSSLAAPMPRDACTAQVPRHAKLTHPTYPLSCHPIVAGELRFQPLSTSITSLPPSLLAAGAGVPFEAGAPNALWAPEVAGFQRRPGETIALTGAFACEGSLRPETGKRVTQGLATMFARKANVLQGTCCRAGGCVQCTAASTDARSAKCWVGSCRSNAVRIPSSTVAGECVLPGTLQDAADYCLRTDECMTFSYRPGGPYALCCRCSQCRAGCCCNLTSLVNSSASLASRNVLRACRPARIPTH